MGVPSAVWAALGLCASGASQQRQAAENLVHAYTAGTSIADSATLQQTEQAFKEEVTPQVQSVGQVVTYMAGWKLPPCPHYLAAYVYRWQPCLMCGPHHRVLPKSSCAWQAWCSRAFFIWKGLIT